MPRQNQRAGAGRGRGLEFERRDRLAVDQVLEAADGVVGHGDGLATGHPLHERVQQIEAALEGFTEPRSMLRRPSLTASAGDSMAWLRVADRRQAGHARTTA